MVLKEIIFLSKFSYFQISTSSLNKDDEKKIEIINKNKFFLFKFNDFISNIFFNFLLWCGKIKLT